MTLSPRQEEVLQLRALGYTNKEIATMLFLAERTVECHAWAAYGRLDAQNLVDALRARGWLVVPEWPTPKQEAAR